MTLPFGPSAVGEQWRANSRLGVAIHGAVLWRRGPEGAIKHNVTLTTRVMEKDSWFTSILLHELGRKAQSAGMLNPFETVCFWSDSGPHYRSLIQISNAAWWLQEAFSISARWCFGMEHHLKGEVDRSTLCWAS